MDRAWTLSNFFKSQCWHFRHYFRWHGSQTCFIIFIDPSNVFTWFLLFPMLVFMYELVRSFPSYLGGLHHVLEHLQEPLCPLVSSSTGQVHPQFPRTLVAYHLLTLQQLDDLARHYHQMLPPTVETGHYIIAMTPWLGAWDEAEIGIHTRRRHFGQFIGLWGFESRKINFKVHFSLTESFTNC